MVENDEKLKEFMQRANADEKEMQRKAKLFDPKKLVSKAAKIKVVEDKDLGTIQYGTIVSEDLIEINSYEMTEDKGFTMLWIALRKAYPDVTLEDVKAFPLEDFTRLMKAIFGNAVSFLPTAKPSQNGSQTPATFRG
jgi:hypothetical protein